MGAVTSVQATPTRRTADNVWTILLLVGHVMLVLFTLLVLAAIMSNQEYMEGRCRWHNLDCSNPWIDVAAWIALGGSALLLLLDLVLGIRLMVKRRLAFYIPLVCCIGQVIVLAATVLVGGWSH